tara:strand:- start:484 stop:624 length:141 start_codon:yes stop_codon:yes gene_type:complete
MYGKEKRMKKMGGGYNMPRKKKGHGGKMKRAMYGHGGEVMPKAKPC